MPIDVEDGTFDNISEIWGIGQNSIEVHAVNGRHFKVHAVRNIRSNTISDYHAHYEEAIELEIEDGIRVFRIANEMPYQEEDSVKLCLQGALRWINERGGER